MVRADIERPFRPRYGTEEIESPEGAVYVNQGQRPWLRDHHHYQKP
jgi:hypothetical protein